MPFCFFPSHEKFISLTFHLFSFPLIYVFFITFSYRLTCLPYHLMPLPCWCYSWVASHVYILEVKVESYEDYKLSWKNVYKFSFPDQACVVLISIYLGTLQYLSEFLSKSDYGISDKLISNLNFIDFPLSIYVRTFCSLTLFLVELTLTYHQAWRSKVWGALENSYKFQFLLRSMTKMKNSH